MRWTFRQSCAEDLDRLYEIWYASVIATHDFVSASDLAEICIQVKEDYLPDRPLLIAVDNKDCLLGFLGMTGCEVESLFIDPRWHRLGLGRAFINEASAHSSYLEVEVNSQNRQAVAFYKAVGFEAYTQSPMDSDGRPYPIMRMRRQKITPATL